MTEPKFTPGPWKFDGEEAGYYDLPTLNIRDKDGYIVAGAVGYIDNSNLSNAHLIAAAPDLYEALSDFAEYENLMEDGDDIAAMLKYGDASRKARAALAKARGEPPCYATKI